MSPTRAHLLLVLGFALSGVAGLIHQVVWMRQLTLLFGATTGAAATTLAVFFLGLALGGAWAGRRAAGLERPLRRFAWLEVGIALSAPLVFLLAPLQESVPLEARGPLLRVGLSALVLLPAAWLMGATLPTLGEALLRARRAWGGSATLLYAGNTFGAACGAFLAAFLLPERIGYRATLGVASGLGLAVAALALWVERGRAATGSAGAQPDASARASEGEPSVMGRGAPARARLRLLAFLSGALALALEVAWTRSFQGVLQNSVYTYALVVVSFLLALTLGSFAAHVLARTNGRPPRVLAGVLLAAAVAVGLAPRFFGLWFDIPRVLSSQLAFWPYVFTAFLSVAGLVLIPTLILGAVFPFLMKVGEGVASVGEGLGRLALWNTLGAALGALLAGFVLVPSLGAAPTMVLCAAVYALAVFAAERPSARRSAVIALVLVGLIAEGLHQADAERERLRPRRYDKALRRYVPDGELLARYPSTMGTVAVTRRGSGGAKRLRLDRGYTLGSSAAPEWERLQAHLPLVLHPEPQRVFFAGLGTGITAGGATVHDVESITAVELVPEVITAAREHFGGLTQGLFDDPRVRLVAGDARQVLRAEASTYDVIISDLFLPWKRGVASLFAVEHLKAARARLAPGGLYAQWLPLYQLSREEVDVIVRTFVHVFPNTSAWHGDFFVQRPILCLIGTREAVSFDLRAAGARMQALAAQDALGFREAGAASLPWLLHIGALGRNATAAPGAPLETEDHPVLEFLAPCLQRERSAGRHPPLVGVGFALWCAEIAVRDPDRRMIGEPRTMAEVGLLHGGLALYDYSVRRRGPHKHDALARFRALVPVEATPDLRAWVK